jgi:hypothetical protein
MGTWALNCIVVNGREADHTLSASAVVKETHSPIRQHDVVLNSLRTTLLFTFVFSME